MNTPHSGRDEPDRITRTAYTDRETAEWWLSNYERVFYHNNDYWQIGSCSVSSRRETTPWRGIDGQIVAVHYGNEIIETEVTIFRFRGNLSTVQVVIPPSSTKHLA